LRGIEENAGSWEKGDKEIVEGRNKGVKATVAVPAVWALIDNKMQETNLRQ